MRLNYTEGYNKDGVWTYKSKPIIEMRFTKDLFASYIDITIDSKEWHRFEVKQIK